MGRLVWFIIKHASRNFLNGEFLSFARSAKLPFKLDNFLEPFLSSAYYKGDIPSKIYTETAISLVTPSKGSSPVINYIRMHPRAHISIFVVKKPSSYSGGINLTVPCCAALVYLVSPSMWLETPKSHNLILSSSLVTKMLAGFKS